jgi:glycosyltransferase involved in cell wall biosynthesis
MENKLKILHVITNLKMGGAERLTLDICSKLAEYEHINVLLVLLENDIEYDVPKNVNIRVLSNKCYLTFKKNKKFKNNEFEQIVNEFSPDIIHSHLFEAEITSKYTIYNNIKYFTHLHDNIRQYKPNLNITKKKNLTDLFERNWIFKKYINTNSKFISISRDTNAFGIKYLPKKLRSNIIYLPNAINLKNFHSSNKNRTNKISLLSIGSLVKKKNHLFLIDVVHYLKSKNIDVELKIIGEGILKDTINNKIRKLNLEKEVRLIGKQTNINLFLNEATFYVHSAIYEPFGLVLLEAMATGTPIISIDGKGNRELITNHENGFILNTTNPILFCDKIIELYNDSNLYNKFHKNGLEFCKRYDINNYVKELLNYYNS